MSESSSTTQNTASALLDSENDWDHKKKLCKEKYPIFFVESFFEERFLVGQSDIASIVARELQGHSIAINKNLWYRFDGHLWIVDDHAHHLIRHIHKIFQCMYGSVYEVIQKDIIDYGQKACNTLDVHERTNWMRKKDNQIKRLESLKALLAKKLANYNFIHGMINKDLIDIEGMLDVDFSDKLNTNPNLIAFNNGVWELRDKRFRKTKPTDYVSLTTKYDFNANVDENKRKDVLRFWEIIFPEPQKRMYMMKCFARQIYGDDCRCKCFLHSGEKYTNSNGKSTLFYLIQHAFGQYIHKFNGSILTAKNKAGSAGAHIERFVGKRIVYCSELSEKDTINRKVLKELTGGGYIICKPPHQPEKTVKPMFALHMICNTTPKIDGSDQGIIRRLRKIDYLSTFVDSESEVDVEKNKYLKDETILSKMLEDEGYKMEFARLLLEHFDIDFDFK